MIKLIGHAFVKGRIDFLRKDNPWAFQRIDAGMKESQRDRILVNPSQAYVELVSAPLNKGEEPEWMEEAEALLRSADSMYLQYKSGGVLRFRRATHELPNNREFVTLGNQDEFNFYADEHWKKVRYLYARRRPGSFLFDVNTMITHKSTMKESTERVEMIAKIDLTEETGIPQVAFDSTGYNASIDIVEWRGTVKEGDIGRYAPENSHIDFTIREVARPITFLAENRKEFNNFSYTFAGDKMRKQLSIMVKKRLAKLEKEIADQETQET